VTLAPRLCVVGLGRVGLPTAAAFAAAGLSVLGADTDAHVVASVNAGRPPFREPGLPELLAGCIADGTLRAAAAPEPADGFILAVPTPLRGRQPDLSHLYEAARAIAPVLRAGDLVVVESTVPVGTTAALGRLLPAGVHLAHCPERATPGNTLAELAAVPRVIGGVTEDAAKRAAALYARIARAPAVLTDARTAELTKLAENASRDVAIAFANELADLCAALGVDADEAIRLANLHPRVGILRPGIGVGGHCLPVDPWFLVAAAPNEARLIRTARTVNDARPARIAAAICDRVAGLRDPVIACLGLTYKKDSDDLRNSPALAIVRLLAETRAGELLVVEPNLSSLPAGLDARLCELDAALARADCAVVLVDHKEFGGLPRGAVPRLTINQPDL